jgi:hypothetical protein
LVATVVRAATSHGRGDDVTPDEEVTTRLGDFLITLTVMIDRLGSAWEAKTMRDPLLCAESEVRITMPERSVGFPQLSLYYDPAQGAYVVAYDNTLDLQMNSRGRDERRVHRDTVVAAFRRDGRPVRFYMTTRRIAWTVAFVAAATVLVFAWFAVERAATR